VVTNIQPDSGTVRAMAPAITRRTKPMAMVKMSMTGWCLSTSV